MLSGFMAGNISAAMAYAGTSVCRAPRPRAWHRRGAIAVGFMIGPALGGVLVGNNVHSASFLLPALVSAALSIVAMLLVTLLLRESVGATERQAHRGRALPATVLRTLAARPALRWLVLAGVLVTFSQSTLESIVALWGLTRFGSAALHRPGPVRPGRHRGGDAGRPGAGAGAALRRTAPGHRRHCGLCVRPAHCRCRATLHLAIGGLALCGLGSGAFSPSASALASRQADAGNRGVVMGTYQAGASLARVLGLQLRFYIRALRSRRAVPGRSPGDAAGSVVHAGRKRAGIREAQQ